jgi:hypothetical protein
MVVKISQYPQLPDLATLQGVGCGAGWIYCSICGRETKVAYLDEVLAPYFSSREEEEKSSGHSKESRFLLTCQECKDSYYKVIGDKICSTIRRNFS